MLSVKPSNIFPALNLETLKVHAQKWADNFLIIQRITLYKSSISPCKYLVVFEAPEMSKGDKLHSYYNKLPETRPELLFLLCYLDKLYPYYRKLSEALTFGSPTLVDDLDEVYIKGPSNDIWDEWHFDSVKPGEEWTMGVIENSSVVLYDKEGGYSEALNTDQLQPYQWLDIDKNENTKQMKCVGPGGKRAFLFKSDYWHVFFEGGDEVLRDLKSLRYIIRLLENPNKEFPHLDLQTLVSGKQLELNKDYSKMNSDQLGREGFSPDIQIDEIGESEKDNIMNIVTDCWDKLQRKEKDSKNQWEFMKNHLLKEYGVIVASTDRGPLFKFKKRLKEGPERARVNTTKQIRNALKRIEIKFPALYDHLEKHIKTDGTCRYEIDNDKLIPWNIAWNK